MTQRLAFGNIFNEVARLALSSSEEVMPAKNPHNAMIVE
jgi:hypothetical protein